MAGDNLLYDVYERRLLAQLDRSKVPAHVGVILDGNRRWAKSLGVGAAHGHRRGADKIAEFLVWAENAGVEIVTLWLLSTDNLSRDPQELAPLLDIIASAVENLASARRWRLRIVGSVELLPQPVAQRLLAAVESTSAFEGMEVNVAVGYGGREEIAQAVRDALAEAAAQGRTLEEVARSLSVRDIAEQIGRAHV